MSSNGHLKVSARGQMSLPSSARNRWDLQHGGEVTYLDLGEVVVIVPNGLRSLRNELLARVTRERWAEATRGFGDDELATQ